MSALLTPSDYEVVIGPEVQVRLETNAGTLAAGARGLQEEPS